MGMRYSPPTADVGKTVTVTSRAALFTRPVRLLSLVNGSPTVVLYEKVLTRHGKGQPKGTLVVRLLDCAGDSCTTLSTAPTTVGRRPRGWQERTVRLPSVTALMPIGHVLRLSISLQPHSNLAGVVIGFDGRDAPSRLEIP
jgi:hypothetical protein